MASNVSQRTVPYYWCSANDDVIYEFDFEYQSIDTATNSSGNTKIDLLSGPFSVTPIVGQYVYIDNDIYRGTHKILSVVAADSFVIDAPYGGALTLLSNCYFLRVPIFSLYKGFKGGETYPTDLPYTKVADIKPSVLYDSGGLPYISINVKGLTRKMFTIVANTVANSTDFSVFNAIRIEWDGLSTSGTTFDYSLVLNCAITNDALQKNFIGYGLYCTPINKPLISTIGVTFVTYLSSNEYPVVKKYLNGVEQ